MQRIMHPNPGADRTWPRSKWKAMDRYCRQMEPIIRPALDRVTMKAMEDLVMFGTAQIRITAGDFQ